MDAKQKILFIDDDRDFGKAIADYFADKPFRLLFAHSLSEGMALLEHERPEHLFLDNRLPDGLGWEKTAFILTHYPEVHLNLLSASEVPKTNSATFRILAKPISLDALLACVN
jgi:DNA-binding response OmpR family regulator